MVILQFEVTNQHINRIDKCRPVADSKNYLLAHFIFLSDEWKGTVTALFTKNDISYKMLLDESNDCFVPWELLSGEGDIYVSCFCGDLVTVDKSRVHISSSGYVEDAENGGEATPSIYNQIIEHVDSLREDMLVIDGGTFNDGRNING